MHVLLAVVYPSQAYGVSCLAVMVGGVSQPSVTFSCLPASLLRGGARGRTGLYVSMLDFRVSA